MLKLNQVFQLNKELVQNSGSSRPPRRLKRKGFYFKDERLTMQCEKRHVSVLRECNQANIFQNPSMSNIIDIPKSLVELSEPSDFKQALEYQHATSECLHTFSSCPYRLMNQADLTLTKSWSHFFQYL